MDSDRELTADDDTRELERAIVPVEPEEIEEVEGADGDDEGHVVGRELIEAEDEDASPLTDEHLAELREMQAAADEEMRALGKPPFDFDAYTQAIREAGAGGLALAEEDQAAFVSYFDEMLEDGVDAAAIGKGVAWYLKMNAGAAEQRHETDLADAGRIQDELKAEWGRDYESNIADSKRFLESHPGIAEAITTARMADGSLLLHQEGFPDFLLSLAKGRSTPAQREASVASTPKERLSQIEQVLRTDSQRYFRDKLDEEAITLRRQLEKTTPRSARPGVAHLESQLSTLKKIMATDPNRYWKENISQRAIEIRRQLEQIAKADAARGQ